MQLASTKLQHVHYLPIDPIKYCIDFKWVFRVEIFAQK